MQLNKDFPRKLYLDTKVLVNGKKKKPRDLNLEKHIELGKWIQDMIDSEELNISCTCENDTCTIKAINDVFQFKYNGLNYQFIDVIHNDVLNVSLLSDIQIQIVDDSLMTDDVTLEIFNSQFYNYPIIKVNRLGSTEQINVLDKQIFTYQILAKCNNEGTISNIATAVIIPSTDILEQFINDNPI